MTRERKGRLRKLEQRAEALPVVQEVHVVHRAADDHGDGVKAGDVIHERTVRLVRTRRGTLRGEQ